MKSTVIGLLCTYISLIYFVTVDRLTAARKFNDSYFTVGEPNLILVSSGKI